MKKYNIVLAILFLAAACNNQTLKTQAPNQQTNTSSSQKQQLVDTSNWKSYSWQGLSLKYPTTWFVRESGTPGHNLIIENKDPYFNIEILRWNDGLCVTLAECLNDEYYFPQTLKYIKVDNILAAQRIDVPGYPKTIANATLNNAVGAIDVVIDTKNGYSISYQPISSFAPIADLDAILGTIHFNQN
jgi:hypothetical protein